VRLFRKAVAALAIALDDLCAEMRVPAISAAVHATINTHRDVRNIFIYVLPVGYR
jgi:hypothetical protein